MYRAEWTEQVELIFDGGMVVIAACSAVSFVAHGEWLLGAGYLGLVSAMAVVARLVYFRPHLVVGGSVLVLAGAFHTRRIPFVEVRRAVASKGALKLKLTDGDEVYVFGNVLWNTARRDCYEPLARTINARIAVVASAAVAQGDPPPPTGAVDERSAADNDSAS